MQKNVLAAVLAIWLAAALISPARVDPDTLGSPTLKPGGAAEVGKTNGTGLRIREEPGIRAKILGSLVDGTRVDVISGPVERDGYSWWRVTAEGRNGWVVGKWLIALFDAPTGRRDIGKSSETPSAKRPNDQPADSIGNPRPASRANDIDIGRRADLEQRLEQLFRDYERGNKDAGTELEQAAMRLYGTGILRLQSDLEGGQKLIRASAEIFERIGRREVLVDVYAYLAGTSKQRGNIEEACDYAKRSRSLASEVKNNRVLGQAIEFIQMHCR